MRSMELVSRERMEVAVSLHHLCATLRSTDWTQQQLSIWGEACDDDVSDVTDKLGVLIYEIGELEDQYVDRYDQYRVTIKSIRNIEASVQPSRDRKSTTCALQERRLQSYRQAEDHRPDSPVEIQGAQLPQDCCPRTGARTC
jgi:hypothetical protein